MSNIPLFTGLNPSCVDLNAMVNTLNANFGVVTAGTNASYTGNGSFGGTLGVTGVSTLTGATNITGLLTANGGLVGGSSANIAINTNKFTVTASNGNTLIAGTLAVTGVLTAATNITSTAGNLLLSSGNATLTSGNIVVTAGNITNTAGYTINSSATVSAAGSNQGGATLVSTQFVNVGTATSNQGIVFVASVAGMQYTVNNASGSTIKVYPSGSETIDGGTASAAVTLTSAHRCATFTCVAAGNWVSALVGAVST